MPAPAVIPAPKAYIKVVAVKKLVVEILAVLGLCFHAKEPAVIRLQVHALP